MIRLSRWSLLLGLVVLIAAGAQFLFLDWTCDDAYISFRYAENLSGGKGLVFNAGERVEGYSNFLWVVLLAAGNFFGIAPVWMAKVLGFLSSVYLILALYFGAGLFALSRAIRALCVLMMSLTAGLAYYAMSGMETVFYAALLLSALIVQKRIEGEAKTPALHLLYGMLFLAALTRPEGVLFILIAGGYHYFCLWRGRFPFKWRELLTAQVIWGGGYLLFLAWRWVYYSSLLPNTFYAKPAGTFTAFELPAIADNLLNGLPSGTFLLLLLPIFLFYKKWRIAYFLPILFVLAQIVFMSYSGDWMVFGRFFFPVLPVVLLLWGGGMKEMTKGNGGISKRQIAVAAAVILLFAGLNAFRTAEVLSKSDSYPYKIMKSDSLMELGERLCEDYPQNTVICLRRQGAVPYFSGLKSIDILGLTDRTIAEYTSRIKDSVEKERKIAEYIIGRAPDLIILFAAEGEAQGWMFEPQWSSHRLLYHEYVLFTRALESGYRVSSIERFGPGEAVVFMERGIKSKLLVQSSGSISLSN